MYASNRYEREMMRIPQNYSGNAFSPPKMRDSAALPETEGVSLAERAEEEIAPAAEGNHAVPATESSDQEQISEEGKTIQASLPATERVGGFPLLRGGLGQEELLLMGMLYLLYSGGDKAGNDEILWLLALLLLAG